MLNNQGKHCLVFHHLACISQSFPISLGVLHKRGKQCCNLTFLTSTLVYVARVENQLFYRPANSRQGLNIYWPKFFLPATEKSSLCPALAGVVGPASRSGAGDGARAGDGQTPGGLHYRESGPECTAAGWSPWTAEPARYARRTAR